MDKPNPRHKDAPLEVSLNLISVWNWIMGKRRKKLQEWLADNRKRRRQNLRYKESPITKSELYDKLEK